MDLSSFLQRARSALSMPVIYWLGKGGWIARQAARPGPGAPIDLAAELTRLKAERPSVHAAYMQALAGSGLDPASLPDQACDCSGFVCWALGVPRDGAPLSGGWINTDAMPPTPWARSACSCRWPGRCRARCSCTRRRSAVTTRPGTSPS